jgi:predicted peptidase
MISGTPLTPSLSPSDGERVAEGRVRGLLHPISEICFGNRFMKTNLNLLLVATAAICFSMNAKAQSTNAPLTAAKFDWKIARTGELRYLLYLPPEYQSSPDKRWPLMLFLHGAGERGKDLQRVAIHGPMSLVKQGTNFPFIIVAPQCPDGQIWENEPLLQLLANVENSYAVDTKRVYLTGLSMGGYGTWSLGLAHPERFAALVPICGGGNMIDVVLGPRDKPEEFKRLPIWAFHGAKDNVVPVQESERMIEELKRLGVANVKLTIYPEAMHDSWKLAYADPAVYEWLLSKSR